MKRANGGRICTFVLLFSPLLPFSFLQAAEYGRVKGRVRDAESGQPVAGAAIEVDGTDYGGTTDETGEYLIPQVPGGVQSLTASAVGYEPARITDVLVILDQTVNVDFKLKSTVISIVKPIEARAERAIVRTQTSTERPMTTAEFARMPVVSLAEIVSLQAGVVNDPTRGTHLRGGRPEEIGYYVDGTATSDPMFGYQAARVNPEATAEVVVISGGFDAEYGDAMSGIVQVITKEGGPKTAGRLAYLTDFFMPKGVNFGYNQIEGSVGGALLDRRLRYFLAPGVNLIGDYNPHLHRLPHQERNDMQLTGKLTYSIPVNGGIKIVASGYVARDQWEEQPSSPEDKNQQGFKYNLDHYLSQRSRVQKLDVAMDHQLTPSMFYNVRVSYFGDQRTRGVRDLVREDTERNFKTRFWEDYIFKAEDSVKAHDSAIYDLRPYYQEQRDDNGLNPFGVNNMFYGVGDYRYFQIHQASTITAKGDFTYNLRKVHELKAGVEVRLNDLYRRYNSLPSDPNPFVDAYEFRPINAAVYLQDRMDFEDLVVRPGLRLDYLDPEAYKKRDPANIDDTTHVPASLKYKLSPRLGVSFPITERTKFRFSYGQFFQTPAYNYLFNSISADAYKRGNNIIGNPDLLPQQTVAYELGVENELSRLLSMDFTAFYKDIYDLLGVRYQGAIPLGYFPMENEEYGSVRGVEVTLAKNLENYWSARLTYSLSLARGTSSYVDEWYRDRYNYGTDPVTGRDLEPPSRDYYLDFDERHNIRADASLEFPADYPSGVLRSFGATLMFTFGSGLPYSVRELASGSDFNSGAVVGEKFSARMPPRYSLDSRLAKGIRIGPLTFDISCDITNLLNTRNIEWVYGYTGLPNDDGFSSTFSPANWAGLTRITVTSGSYHPARDLNHDGFITAEEEYVAYKAAYQDFVNNPNNYGAPRQIRFGISLEF